MKKTKMKTFWGFHGQKQMLSLTLISNFKSQAATNMSIQSNQPQLLWPNLLRQHAMTSWSRTIKISQAITVMLVNRVKNKWRNQFLLHTKNNNNDKAFTPLSRVSCINLRTSLCSVSTSYHEYYFYHPNLQTYKTTFF